jgi:hypothetical protein
MSAPQNVPPGESGRDTSRGNRFAMLIGAMLLFCVLCAVHPETVRAAWAEFERIIQLKSTPLPASPPQLSEHEVKDLDGIEPQQQATLLLQRAINHYDGAIELVAQRVDSWRGRLDRTQQLGYLMNTALDSNDLRVRAASIEIDLAVSNVAKSPDSVLLLMDRAQKDAQARPSALWTLGALGNRGVEVNRVQDFLLDRAKEPDESTRYWTAVALGVLGTDVTIPVLLDLLHNDPSPGVRERAACSLAQSGMLTRDQRLMAVPELLRFSDDPSLDPTTRSWVFQALRDITGQSLGTDPNAWRSWWAGRSRG